MAQTADAAELKYFTEKNGELFVTEIGTIGMQL